MIGVYDYTVWLTYLSLISASIGMVISLQGQGHPYMGVFCLMICGLCDSFDGKVARTKKNRTDFEKKFGIQIDSLSDLVAFGVLPACIGNAMIRRCPTIAEIPEFIKRQSHFSFPVTTILFAIAILYILAALIRLAYFNVMEEERQKKEEGSRKYYTGLPVTSSALIFPTVLLIQYLVREFIDDGFDITLIYFVVMVLTGIGFLAKFRIKKPGLRGILLMVAAGAVEFLVLVGVWLYANFHA